MCTVMGIGSGEPTHGCKARLVPAKIYWDLNTISSQGFFLKLYLVRLQSNHHMKVAPISHREVCDDLGEGDFPAEATP